MLEKFEKMLYVFACAAHGKHIESIGLSGQELYEFSNSQRVWPIVYGLLKKYNLIQIPSNIEKNTTNQIYSNMRRTLNVSKKIEMLEENGIKCCVLKGATLSCLYAEPYARLTTDSDIYIFSEDEKRACELLRQSGFEIKEKSPGSHHIKCINYECGMVELHTECFDTVVAKLWFDGADFFEYQLIPFKYEGVDCHTLNHSEAIIFNFLHFVKHYITGLVTVRQLMDNLLYLKKYRDEIDYEKVDMVLERLNYKKFFLVCIGFGIKYLQFRPEDFAYTVPTEYSESVELMLSDFYCAAGSEESGVYTEYGKKVYSDKNKKGNYERYKLKTNSGGFLKMAKVSREVMEAKYPTLEKYPYLYPIFYIYRAFSGIFNKLYRQKAPADTGKIKRLEVLDKLGL